MLTSQLEIIKQAQLYLSNVTEKNYTAIESPNFISSAGSHIRHIIDHYQAIITGIEKNFIDYDDRQRGNQIEFSTELAFNAFEEIVTWLKTLSQDDFAKPITLSTQVSLSKNKIQTVQTSVARELIFAGSHAVHHYAMIAQIAYAQHSPLAESFGIAPATASFIRQSSKNDDISKKSA